MSGAPHPAAPLSSAQSRMDLVAILRLAYSGELAAAHAYRGHARSVADLEERRHIEEIEAEEWHHRALVGEILARLGERPSRLHEFRAALIGRVLGALCHLAGWLAPMYGAGRLESRNVREYEAAARLAHACGRDEWVDCLLCMAEVEWEHERYFRSRVLTHRLSRHLPMWPAPAPKESIRGQPPAIAPEARSDQASSAPEAAMVSSTRARTAGRHTTSSWFLGSFWL